MLAFTFHTLTHWKSDNIFNEMHSPALAFVSRTSLEPHDESITGSLCGHARAHATISHSQCNRARHLASDPISSPRSIQLKCLRYENVLAFYGGSSFFALLSRQPQYGVCSSSCEVAGLNGEAVGRLCVYGYVTHMHIPIPTRDFYYCLLLFGDVCATKCNNV